MNNRITGPCSLPHFLFCSTKYYVVYYFSKFKFRSTKSSSAAAATGNTDTNNRWLNTSAGGSALDEEVMLTFESIFSFLVTFLASDTRILHLGRANLQMLSLVPISSLQSII